MTDTYTSPSITSLEELVYGYEADEPCGHWVRDWVCRETAAYHLVVKAECNCMPWGWLPTCQKCHDVTIRQMAQSWIACGQCYSPTEIIRIEKKR